MTRFILWSDDAALEAAAVEAIDAAAVQVDFDRCAEESELRARLQSSEIGLVLADLGATPLARLRQLEALVLAHPASRFIVASEEVSDDLVQEAMQVGARSCLAKASVGASLPALVQRLLGAGRPTGRLIAVTAAKGGAGASTLSLGLAEELRRDGDEALLVDLDLDYGGLSRALTRGATFGLGDVLDRGSEVDKELVRSTAIDVGEGLRLLPSPAAISLEAAARTNLEGLSNLMHSAREVSAVTVVDAPRLPIELAAELARTADVTLLVMQLAVVDLRSARATRSALIEHGVAPDEILPIVNRHRRRGAVLTLEDAADALDGARPHPVANDYDAACRSLDLGRPLATVAPRSPARRDLRRLAESLHPVSAPTQSLPSGTR